MEYVPLDPYEQQLQKVFDNHDLDNRGSLDRDGLLQLCSTLQLEEQGAELVQHLLKSTKLRVTFVEFKDALLALLGNVQNNKMENSDNEEDKEDENSSPDREVSPKYVYGSKKYGRRSRPRNDGVFDDLNENDYANKVAYNNAVQRSNSQNDVLYLKKRKTATKLKRCTSFSGHECQLPDDAFVTNSFNEEEFVCTEDMLRKAWKELGVGDNGFLNQTELILVCDAIGLHRLAKSIIRQLPNKFKLDSQCKISFQEVLEALQQDETWLEVLSPSPTESEELSNCTASETIFPESKSSPNITLGPDGTGFVNIDVLSEIWENVGITSSKFLLRELGFVHSQISVAELSTALEKEIKGLNEAKSINFANPLLMLLQAVSELYKTEIKYLKSLVEQMHAEREKLKTDVFDANNRALMLAQEVDDNHTRMVQNTQNQLKGLEQKHSDMMKDLAKQFSNEKEQIINLNQNLERKILCLEAEEAKLNNDLSVAKDYLRSAENENQVLSGQITELQHCKEELTKQITIFENDKQNYEYENQQVQIEPLLQKLSTLQIENSQLKDKNDEMLTEIESLNNQISSMRSKGSSTPTYHNLEHSMEEDISAICDGIGHRSKRRNDESPSKDLNILGLGDASPRLGKVRKCHKTKLESIEFPVTSSESGFDTVDSSFSVSLSEKEEINVLQSKIAYLEELLKKHSIPFPEDNFKCMSDNENIPDDTKIKILSKRCVDLQNLLLTVKTDLHKLLSKNDLDKDLRSILAEDKSFVDASTETNSLDFEDEIKKCTKENLDLVNKCAELESCIELIKNEYEKCEDYWSSKLDDERQMFEQEQHQSTEKLNELINKIAEYDAQFGNQDEPDYRLPPIEETYNLEKQFTDLEQEFEDYKEETSFELTERSNEITDLKERLTLIEEKVTSDCATQTEPLREFSSEDKRNNLTNCLIESTNLFSSDTMPFEESSSVWNKSNLPSLESNASAETPVAPNFWPRFLPGTKPSFSVSSLPSSSEFTSTNNATPSRPKRTRKHERNYKVQRMHKTENAPSTCGSSFTWSNVTNDSRTNPNEQRILLPVAVLHNLNGRLHHLEQKCRHLQVVLKQQHYHSEQILQNCWQQYRGEKAELRYLLKNSQEKLESQIRVCNEQLERLARTDMLVKDLYVENSYLVANVHRLEKQCHILTQYNSTSSSV